MAVELKKINPACRNVSLIDSNECIGNSLEKINDTVLYAKDFINKTVNDFNYNWKETLTYFQIISSQLLITALNVQAANNTYKAPYTTIQKLSSQWNKKEFSVYYPEILPLSSFYDDIEGKKYIIRNWLETNFPKDKFPINQNVNIYVNLHASNTFEFSFQGSYLESCSPTAHSDNTLTCEGCGGDGRNAGCNIDGGGCFNAYSRCSVRYVSDEGTYNCVGTISSTYVFDTSHTPNFYDEGFTGNTRINYTIKDIEDKFIGRIVSFRLKNIKGYYNGYEGWQYQDENISELFE